MGIFKYIFGSSPTHDIALSDVARIESIIASADQQARDRGEEPKPIDEKKLPKRKDRLKKLLMDEINKSVNGNFAAHQTNRLANCYLDLARFQIGVDAAHRELKLIFDPNSPTFVEWRGISPAVDKIEKNESDMKRDIEQFRLDLKTTGYRLD